MGQLIDILMVVDTDAIRSKYPDPSQDQAAPTRIDGGPVHMIVTGAAVDGGQGGSDPELCAKEGDTLRGFGSSGSGNFEDAVLITGLLSRSEGQVLGGFESCGEVRSTVAPGSRRKALPPRLVMKDFRYYQAEVKQIGTEDYTVQFALYGRDAESGQPTLSGYFECDRSIRIRSEE